MIPFKRKPSFFIIAFLNFVTLLVADREENPSKS